MKNVGCYMMALAISVVLFSCKKSPEMSMLTVVHNDGSITREFSEEHQVENPDSSGIRGINKTEENSFPVELDSTWNQAWSCENQVFRSEKSIDSLIEKNKERDIVYVHLIRKDFASAEDMARNFHLEKSHPWANVKISSQLDKKFRWFYTDYAYKETYSKLHVRFTYALNKFMSKDEADYWFSGNPNLTEKMTGMEARDYLGQLENKYENWLKKNLWSDEFDLIIDNYGLVKDKPVSKEKLISLKDSLFKTALENEQETDAVLDAYFKTKAFSELMQHDNGARDSLAQAKHSAVWERFQYKLCMPGKILRSNCDAAGKDTLAWNISGFKFLTKNYVIEAESRKTNVWAFILTGLIIAVAIGSFFVRKNARAYNATDSQM